MKKKTHPAEVGFPQPDFLEEKKKKKKNKPSKKSGCPNPTSQCK